MWFLLLLVLIGIWLWPQVWERYVNRSVYVKVTVDDPIVDFGDEVTFRFTLLNTSRLPCPRVHCSIRLPAQLYSGNPERPDFAQFSSYVMPKQQVEVTFALKTVKRGYGKLAQAEFILVDGLGIRRVYRTYSLNTGVVVRPRPVDPVSLPARLTDLIGDVRTRRFFNEDPSLLVGLRPYQTGDPMKYVSWYATARVGELMVKQFGYTTTARCLLVLSGTEYSEVLDKLCERAVQLTEHLTESGLAVGLFSNLFDGVNRTFYESPSGGQDQVERVRNKMGSLEAIPFMSLTHQLYQVPQYASSGDMIVVLCGAPSEPAAVALTQLRRSHPNVHLYTILDEDDRVPRLHGVSVYVERYRGPRTAAAAGSGGESVV